jgi:hypothetical protein
MTNTPTPTHSHTPTLYSAFSPLLLTLIGLLVLLSWNLRGIVIQTSNLQTAKFQVWQATIQSAQTETKLQAMLTDLIELGSEDPAAAVIVKRYGIKQNAPPAAAPVAVKSEQSEQ